MIFDAHRLLIENETIHLTEKIHNNKNRFTLLTGKNASGKTRLLSKIANHFIFDDKKLNVSDLYVKYEKLDFFDYTSYPSRVIAISNTRFDRFPSDSYISTKKREGISYKYLGFNNRSDRDGSISESIANLLSDSSLNNRNYALLDNILRYAGFRSHFKAQIFISAKISKFKVHYDTLSFVEAFRIHCHSVNVDVPYDMDYHQAKSAIDFLSELENNQKQLTIDFDLSMVGSATFSVDEYNSIAFLLRCKILTVKNLRLLDAKEKVFKTLNETSSGQQCMLQMFIGLAGVIKDDSLICIDEPEVCLHPKWQSEFIELIQKSFSHLKRCHFVIATHSPQIVSGLISANGFILDLEKNELHKSVEYAKRSADFQLSKIFNEPGFKNEYLIRLILTLIAKVTTPKPFDSEDRENLEFLYGIQGRINDDDPVFHLIRQLKALAND